MFHVACAGVTDAFQESAIVFVLVDFVVLVLPRLVVRDAVLPLIEYQIAGISETKQVLSLHQKRCAHPTCFQNGLSHHRVRLLNVQPANFNENSLNQILVDLA